MNEISLSRCSHYVAILLILVRISFATTLYLPQVVGVCKELQLAYVCDPDQILTTTQVSQLNSAINDVATSTPCPCSSQVCSSSASPRGYTVGIALVNRMQHDVSITSIGSDPVSNNDNEQAEKLNSQLQLSKLYASTLLSSWPLSRCGDTAVIFFALNESVYYTATGDAVSSLLTADVVGEIAANARISFTTNIADGLQKLLANYNGIQLTEVRKSVEKNVVICKTSAEDLKVELKSIFYSNSKKYSKG